MSRARATNVLDDLLRQFGIIAAIMAQELALRSRQESADFTIVGIDCGGPLGLGDRCLHPDRVVRLAYEIAPITASQALISPGLLNACSISTRSTCTPR